jgi:hypothetical protein
VTASAIMIAKFSHQQLDPANRELRFCIYLI